MKVNIFLILVLFSSWCQGQTWHQVKVIELDQNITSFSIDPDNKIYVGTELGALFRFDSEGRQEQHFSEINFSPVTLTEAWNRLKIFMFFRENQKICVLDRFATTPKIIELTETSTQFATLVAPAVDNGYWILDGKLNELKKIENNSISLSVPITPQEIALQNVSFMRAYQNLLILTDPISGIYFFDQFGNYLDKIAVTGVTSLQTRNELLISSNGNDIIQIDPFRLETKILFPLPHTGFVGMLMTATNYFFFQKNRIHIYEIRD